MENPFGSSPIIASFQGHVSGGVLATYSSYGVQVTRTAAGVFSCVLPTGTTPNNVLVQPGGANMSTYTVNVTYASAAQSDEIFLDTTNQTITLAVTSSGTPTDPVGIFNFIFYACTDGVNDNAP